MNFFPHFAPLPPATPAQAQAILSRLKVTPEILQLGHISSALALAGDVYAPLLYWLLLKFRYSCHVDQWLEKRLPEQRFIRALLTYTATSLLFSVLFLPLGIIAGWVVPRHYHLSTESFLSWMNDHMKFIAIHMIIYGPLFALLAVFIRRFQRLWPYLFAALLTPLIAFGIFLEPVLIEPIFNKFVPLSQSQPLYNDIHSLAMKAEIPNARIFIVDKSRQTNEMNAYVTGFGSSLRIVLWDTTIKKMPPREIVAIMGHEMGHYVEGHLLIGFVLGVVGLFVLLPALRWMAEAILRRYGERWKIRRLYDPAAIPLMLLCLQIGLLIMQPAVNVVSRWIEHRADAFSLGLVRDRLSLAQSFVAFSRNDLDNPYPPQWEIFWFDDHPPLGERVKYSLYGQPE